MDRDGDFNGGAYATEALGTLSATLGTFTGALLSGAMTPAASLRIRSLDGGFDLADRVDGLIIDDAMEPNNDAYSAAAVLPTDSIPSLVAFDEDWFTATLPAPGRFTTIVRLDMADAQMGMELWRFDSSPSFVSTAIPGGSTGRLLTASMDAPAGLDRKSVV